MGYSPWGHKESDTTEPLHFTSMYVSMLLLPFVPTSPTFRMSDSRWVITPSWISGSLRSFLYGSVCAHLCMKCSLGISNFLEEIANISHSIVFLYFFALITEEGFFYTLLAILWNSEFKWIYLSFPPLPLVSLLFIAVCKVSSDNHFAFLFLGDGLDHCLLYNVMNLHP